MSDIEDDGIRFFGTAENHRTIQHVLAVVTSARTFSPAELSKKHIEIKVKVPCD
jgi:hypothetical protein